MSKTVAELAQLVGGRVVGDASVTVHAAKPLEEAGPGEITFVENAKWAGRLAQSKAAAAIVDPSIPPNGMPLIVVDDPLCAFVAAIGHLVDAEPRRTIGVHPHAWVSPKARIGRDVNVFPGAFVDDDVQIGDRCEIHSGACVGRHCRLGDDVVLHPNVVLYPRTEVGNRTIIHAGAVIGADGFGYRHRGGRHVKVPQLGAVKIGDDVEIGANTTIDRGTFGTTVIGDGTKIDNLVQVAHNCRIGRHNLLVAQTGIAGSCTTGDYVVTAGQAGIRDHVNIGSGARIGAKAGVIGDVPAGTQVIGSPATPEWEHKRLVMTLARLPEMRRQLREMQKQLDRLCPRPAAGESASRPVGESAISSQERGE
ncbi:MAG: UDP-3-O-(3-hydroxymyristoyl)glucosamine N-acyltransferase [Planctomycetes bacterium]|nr:UDP-3-O-(3-hydroxymyristoyl)glucosamine N-acyltransferase [Planctomycetota bacterium]